MIADRIQAALGNKPADLVIENGQIVNVYTGEIYPGGVAISGDTIIAVGDVAYAVGADTQVLDAQGAYLTPGFIDGHIHPESTSLAIRPCSTGAPPSFPTSPRWGWWLGWKVSRPSWKKPRKPT